MNIQESGTKKSFARETKITLTFLNRMGDGRAHTQTALLPLHVLWDFLEVIPGTDKPRTKGTKCRKPTRKADYFIYLYMRVWIGKCACLGPLGMAFLGTPLGRNDPAPG